MLPCDSIRCVTTLTFRSAAGSYALVGAEVPEDATVITKLKDAGAIILGTAGMSQWMNFRSSDAPNGWSAYGGQVYGAYHADQEPCGSSSGSAVASDLGLAFGAIGTEVTFPFLTRLSKLTSPRPAAVSSALVVLTISSASNPPWD